jgi:hypothetical protein
MHDHHLLTSEPAATAVAGRTTSLLSPCWFARRSPANTEISGLLRMPEDVRGLPGERLQVERFPIGRNQDDGFTKEGSMNVHLFRRIALLLTATRGILPRSLDLFRGALFSSTKAGGGEGAAQCERFD